MAVRQIFRLPDPVLKRVAIEAAPEEWARVERVADDLVETMRGFPRCVGLAAPQIGESVRMVVVDVSLHPKGDPSAQEILLINPRVVFCLLYTSDAADDLTRVDLGGRR